MTDIVPKKINELQFVDGTPNPYERPDQKRIDWMLNGDCLGAAENIFDNGGELNRSGVQIQQNAVTLIGNDKIIHSSLDEVIERVNVHEKTLGELGDHTLATKVQEMDEKLEPLPARIDVNEANIKDNTHGIELTSAKIGTRAVEDETIRTIYADLLFAKKEIGNYAGQDINGTSKPEIVQATGLKYAVYTQGAGLGNLERKVDNLEKEWLDSDVGSLTTKVNDIRAELGKTEDAPTDKTVYEWIKEEDAKVSSNTSEINKIKADIGTVPTGSTVMGIVGGNTTLLGTHETQIQSLETATESNSTNISSNTSMLSSHANRLGELEANVGSSASDGLRGIVTGHTNEIGTDVTPGTIKGRISNLEKNQVSQLNSIVSLSTQVGSNTAGSETGLHREVKELKENKLDDAPKDGHTYGRRDGQWFPTQDRVRGGCEATGNTASQAVNNSTPVIVTAQTITDMGINNGIEKLDDGMGIKYKGTGTKVVTVTSSFQVETTPSQDIIFQIHITNSGAADTVLPVSERVVTALADSKHVNLSYPATIMQDQEIKLMVLGTETTQNFTIKNAVLYVTEI